MAIVARTNNEGRSAARNIRHSIERDASRSAGFSPHPVLPTLVGCWSRAKARHTGCRLKPALRLCAVDADAPLVFRTLELHLAVDQGVYREVIAQTDADSRMELGAALANDDAAW